MRLLDALHRGIEKRHSREGGNPGERKNGFRIKCGMTYRDKEECMETQLAGLRISIMLLLIICGSTLCISAGNALAGAKVKAEGVLTAREGNTENRSVIINDKGYLVSPSARILDANGGTISLDRMSLPVRVYYHYEYTKTGPVITFMKGYPKVMPQ